MNSRWIYFQVHGRMPARKSPRRQRGGKGPARNWRYRAWIRSLGCALCGSTWRVEAAHTGSDGGMKLKASDYSCIPLCWNCHQGAAYSYHQSREAFTARLYRRLRIGVAELVQDLNREWRAGRQEAA